MYNGGSMSIKYYKDFLVFYVLLCIFIPSAIGAILYHYNCPSIIISICICCIAYCMFSVGNNWVKKYEKEQLEKNLEEGQLHKMKDKEK